MRRIFIAASVLWALCIPTGTAFAQSYVPPYVEPAAHTDWQWQRLHNRAKARWFMAQKPVARWYVTRPHAPYSWHWHYAGYW